MKECANTGQSNIQVYTLPALSKRLFESGETNEAKRHQSTVTALDTRLFDALSQKRYDEAKSLIFSGVATLYAPVDASMTGLYYAINSGDVELCEMVFSIDKKAIDVIDVKGRSILHHAAISKNRAALEWVLSKGVNPFWADSNTKFAIDFIKQSELRQVLLCAEWSYPRVLCNSNMREGMPFNSQDSRWAKVAASRIIRIYDDFGTPEYDSKIQALFKGANTFSVYGVVSSFNYPLAHFLRGVFEPLKSQGVSLNPDVLLSDERVLGKTNFEIIKKLRASCILARHYYWDSHYNEYPVVMRDTDDYRYILTKQLEDSLAKADGWRFDRY